MNQYLHYSTEDGGEFYTPASGICRGCSLSPLIGDTLLSHVDARLSGMKEMYYVRSMDDFLILSDRRRDIHRVREYLYRNFDLNGFTAHPDKTLTGKTETRY